MKTLYLSSLIWKLTFFASSPKLLWLNVGGGLGDIVLTPCCIGLLCVKEGLCQTVIDFYFFRAKQMGNCCSE